MTRMNHLSRILPAGNVVLDMLATSKKRAFEQAGLLLKPSRIGPLGRVR